MPFTTPLVVRRLDSCHWVLIAPLSYQGSVDQWTVPSNYRTDFATVPRWLQSFVQATGAWTLAAVLHDWMITDGIPAGVITSRDTDGVFRRVLREEGVGPVRRWAMWAAVRLAAPFSSHRRPSGFLRDAPAVLVITALGLVAVAGLAYGVHRAVDLILALI